VAALRRRWIGILILVGALYAVPVLVDHPYTLHVLTVALIYGVLASSVNLSLGYAGMLSMGHMGFAGIGAYTMAILVQRLSFPYWLAFLSGVVLAGLAGIAVGVPSVKLRRSSFVIVTLAFGIIMHLFFNNLDDLTGGAVGLPDVPRPPALQLGSWAVDFTSNTTFYFLVATTAIVVVGMLHLIARSGFGHLLVSIREDEELALMRGVNVKLYKVVCLGISAGLAGVGGMLLGSYLRVVAPMSFEFRASIDVVLITVLGGVGTLAGPLLGAGLFVALPEYLRITNELRLVIFGLILVVLILYSPQGLMKVVEAAIGKVSPGRAGRHHNGDSVTRVGYHG